MFPVLAGQEGSQFPAVEAVPVSFCCSESPHGERALTEDSVQDVTAEHHTSDDGKGGLVFTGVYWGNWGRQGRLCLFKDPRWG